MGAVCCLYSAVTYECRAAVTRYESPVYHSEPTRDTGPTRPCAICECVAPHWNHYSLFICVFTWDILVMAQCAQGHGPCIPKADERGVVLKISYNIS